MYERPYFAHVAAFLSQPEEGPTYAELKARIYPPASPQALEPIIASAVSKPYRSSHEPDGGGLALGLAMGIGLGGMFHGC